MIDIIYISSSCHPGHVCVHTHLKGVPYTRSYYILYTRFLLSIEFLPVLLCAHLQCSCSMDCFYVLKEINVPGMWYTCAHMKLHICMPCIIMVCTHERCVLHVLHTRILAKLCTRWFVVFLFFVGHDVSSYKTPQHQYEYLKNEAMYRTTLCGRRLKRVCGCVLLCSSTPCSCGRGTMNKSRTVAQRTLLVTFCSNRCTLVTATPTFTSNALN